jgi:L-ascorbate metabolism protein UlaG (beta-lactamase superfamily)
MYSLRITLIGGPTALIEIDGFRLLTDPTFDPPGDYQLPHVKLEKLTAPVAERRRNRRGRCGTAQS